MSIGELYDMLIEQIKGKRGNGIHRKLANNTYGRIEDGRVIIKLHNTDIVTIDIVTIEGVYRNRIIYTPDIWFTPTTRDRINRYMPDGWKVCQASNVWWLYHYTSGWGWDRPVTRFYDGLTLVETSLGVMVEGNTYHDDPEKELRDSIKQYAKLYTPERVAELVNSGGGDCLYCQVAWNHPEQPWNGDHLLLHVSESYTMVTLAANAIRAAGYKPEVYLNFPRGNAVLRRCIVKYLNSHLLNRGLKLYTEQQLEAM